MKIYGIILNGKNKSAVQLAKIKLKVQDKEIATIFTDEYGRFEHATDEDYTGSVLTYTIEKDGFEEKTYHSVIGKHDIQKKFLLREHEKIADTKTSLKFTVVGIGIIVAAVLLFFFLQPIMDVDSGVLVFSSDLNDKQTQTFNITTRGNLNWTITPDEWWIKVEPDRGNDSRVVNVTVYTPDTEVSPVDNVTTELKIRREGGWLNGLFAQQDFKKVPNISVSENRYNPRLKVTKPGNVSLDPYSDEGFNISIQNEGDGGLFWSVRDDVKWIELKEVDGKIASENSDEFRFVGFDEGIVTFGINHAKLNLKDEPKQGNITIDSNNDGKFKINFTVNRSEGEIFLKSILYQRLSNYTVIMNCTG